MKEKNKEVVSAFILIGISVVGLFLTLDIPQPFREYDLGAAFLPRLTLVLIIGLSVLKIVVAVIENKSGGLEKIDKSQLKKGFGTILLVGLYCFLYEPVGFLINTLVYLFFQMMILTPKNKRKIWKLLLIDAASTAAIYLIFNVGFSVRLPHGLAAFF